MTNTLDTPRIGPCAPWTSGEALAELPAIQHAQVAPSASLLAQMATVATEILYELSGQQFSGECGPVEVRPLSRPVDADTRYLASVVGMGYLSSWGTCTAYGFPRTGAVAHYGCSNPPEVELGAYPVTEVTQVKIDGVVIPPTEWFVQDRRTLVRRRPTASASPTQRYGWPTCQLIDLPDDQVGTFSVIYMYGVAPPASGVLAAQTLATLLALDAVGQSTRLPQRITQMTRQGVSAMIVDVMDFLKGGLTGIYEVDLFLRTFNPSGARRPASVWSPDIGRPCRMPSGSR